MVRQERAVLQALSCEVFPRKHLPSGRPAGGITRPYQLRSIQPRRSVRPEPDQRTG